MPFGTPGTPLVSNAAAAPAIYSLPRLAARPIFGLTPNCFAEDGNHAYNSADASLWYAFAVQCYLKENPDGLNWVRERAWPALKAIVEGYRQGPGMDIYVDENGLLTAARTQGSGYLTVSRGGASVTIPIYIKADVPFVDMEGHWASTYMSGLYHQGILTGTTVDSKLYAYPDKGVTRAEFSVLLCRYLGINLADSMAIGDSSNDASMVEAAGVGAAMGSAHPALKELADGITDTNDRDGVAKAIARFCPELGLAV